PLLPARASGGICRARPGHGSRLAGRREKESDRQQFRCAARGRFISSPPFLLSRALPIARQGPPPPPRRALDDRRDVMGEWVSACGATVKAKFFSEPLPASRRPPGAALRSRFTFHVSRLMSLHRGCWMRAIK